MHDDVRRPEGSMGVVVTLKSKLKMAASSAISGGNSKITQWNPNISICQGSNKFEIIKLYRAKLPI